jgi:prevent-host-death family protein
LVGGRRSIVTRGQPQAFDVSETRKRFSELVARVAFGGATILVTRRGRPMARLVPVEASDGVRHLADVEGWLPEGCAFLRNVEEIVAARTSRRPRVVGTPSPTRRRRVTGR